MFFVLGPELEGRKPPGMSPKSKEPSNMNIQGVSKKSERHRSTWNTKGVNKQTTKVNGMQLSFR